MYELGVQLYIMYLRGLYGWYNLFLSSSIVLLIIM